MKSKANRVKVQLSSSGSLSQVKVQDRKLHVLLAEDDDEDWLLISEVIDECALGGHILVERVTDGKRLLDRLRDVTRSHPDIILLDIQMPRMNGLETLREIRRDVELQAIPVIMLTTSEAESDVLRSYQGGANSYVVKPMEAIGNLLNALRYYWVEVCRIPVPRQGLPVPA